jgi:hypothetical protein
MYARDSSIAVGALPWVGSLCPVTTAVGRSAANRSNAATHFCPAFRGRCAHEHVAAFVCNVPRNNQADVRHVKRSGVERIRMAGLYTTSGQPSISNCIESSGSAMTIVSLS